MTYSTGFMLWREGAFGLEDFSLNGAAFEGPTLVLDPERAIRRPLAPGEANEGRSGTVLVAEALSPPVETRFPALTVIPSWNACCPEGTGLVMELRAGTEEGWTPWYRLGRWSEDSAGPFGRSSLSGQEDDFARVLVDTLVLKEAAEQFQARVRLFAFPDAAPPVLRALAFAYSGGTLSGKRRPSPPGLRDRELVGLPASSQMIYPDGGDVWCSPTAVSMVLGYWEGDPRTREARIRAAVAGVYDTAFDGHGNWSFNVAYAGSRGYEAYVCRFADLSSLEPWIAAGIPVIMSLSWDRDAGRPLEGAPLARSRGHLTVLVGFDAAGDPIMHEPAAPEDATVRRRYARNELEARWLEASGGTTYLIFPEGRRHPSFMA